MKSSDSNPDNVTVELSPVPNNTGGFVDEKYTVYGRPIRCVRQLPDDPPPGT